MTKITYLLGAGASYNACPIWNMQAQAMRNLGSQELTKDYVKNISNNNPPTDWLSEDSKKYIQTNKQRILREILYFGTKALEFNTIDTYARKLFLQNKTKELELLKMSVSVFFDLWENFNKERSFFQNNNQKENKYWKQIDSRYINLFSIFLEKSSENLVLNEDVNFITWNYDLQLEMTYNSFAYDSDKVDFELIDNNLPFLEKQDSERINKVFHLNGHRGFASGKEKESVYELCKKDSFDDYWKTHEHLYDSLKSEKSTFQNHIKYGWEHDLNSDWFQKIGRILKQTDILVIIGYSFPLFNRRIDQFLFSHLHQNKIKEIIYQDPYSDDETILNLFKHPERFESKIRLLKETNQFHIPHTHFINQGNSNSGFEIRAITL